MVGDYSKGVIIVYVEEILIIKKYDEKRFIYGGVSDNRW